MSKSLISEDISLTWLLFDLTITSKKKSTVTESLESINYCNKSYFNVSVIKPSTIYRTVRNIANIDCPSFITELSTVSEFLSVEKTKQKKEWLWHLPEKNCTK